MVTRKLILTGGRAGMTGVIDRRWPAQDGVITLQGNISDVDALTKYLGRCYAAFPEGSEELARHGKGEVHPGGGDGQAGSDVPGLQQGQQGPAQVPADQGSGADGTPAAGAGGVPGGDGQQDPGYDGEARKQEAVRQAVSRLDPLNDEHWTQEGLPRVDVVSNILSRPDLTRKELNDVAGDLVRPKRDG